MNLRAVLIALSFLGIFHAGLVRGADPARPQRTVVITPELKSYIKKVKTLVERNFSADFRRTAMLTPAGRAVLLFEVRGDGTVMNAQVTDVTGQSGLFVATAARHALLYASDHFGPAPPELQRSGLTLSFRLVFTNRGIKPLNGAD